MFGVIFGYGIFKFMEKFGGQIFIIGGLFGLQENFIVQVVVMGVGGIGGIFVVVIFVMYCFGVMFEGYLFMDDIGVIFIIILVCFFVGLFYVMFFCKFFIVQVVCELKFMFFMLIVVVFIICFMYVGVVGSFDVMKKFKCFMICFVGVLIYCVVLYYVIGILYDWYFFMWIYIWSGYISWVFNIEFWGWYFEWILVFIGFGILIGFNFVIFMFVGVVIVWGFIGFLFVYYGECIGIQLFEDFQWDFYYSFVFFRNFGMVMFFF